MSDPTTTKTATLKQQPHLPINFKSVYTQWWIECSETCGVVPIKYSCVAWSFVGLVIGKYAGGRNIIVQARCEGINPWDFFLWLINHRQWTSMCTGVQSKQTTYTLCCKWNFSLYKYVLDLCSHDIMYGIYNALSM